MLNLGTLFIGIKTDGKKAETELDGVKRKVQATEQEVRQAADNMGNSWRDFGGKVGSVCTVGFAAAGAAVAGLIGVASESAADFGKLDAAFEKTGFSAQTAQGTFKDFVGIMGETDTAVEASNHLAQLCNNEKELSSWGNIAAGVFATFGDSLPLEGLTEAANETAKVGTVTGSLADALNWVGISEDDFNTKLAECSSEAERAKLITDTLNQAYGQTGQKFRENNADLIAYQETQAQFQQALSNLGLALMPLATELMNLGVILAQKIQPALDFIKNHSEQLKNTFIALVPVIKGVVAGFIAFKAVMMIASLISAVRNTLIFLKTAMTGVTIAQGLLNIVMMANPFVLIATLIAAVVAALVVLWHKNEGFRKAVTKAWNAIKSCASKVWTSVCNFFTKTVPNAINTLKNKFMNLPSSIRSALSRVLASVVGWAANMKNKAVQAGQNFKNGLVNKMNEAVSWVRSIPRKITSALGNLGSCLVNAGKQIISGLINGLKSKWEDAKSFLSGITKKIPKLKGPEVVDKKLLLNNGGLIMQGLLKGMKNDWRNVESYLSSRGVEIQTTFGDKALKNGMKPFDVNGYSNYRKAKRTNSENNPKETNKNITVNNYSPKALTEKESARQFKNTMKRLAMA